VGIIYEPVSVRGANRYGIDDDFATKIREWTEKELDGYVA